MSMTHSKNQPSSLHVPLWQNRATPLFALLAGSISLLGLPIQSIAADHAAVEVKIIRTRPHPPKLQYTVWWQVARRHQIDPYLLYATALVESRKQGKQQAVTPWPWAINHAGESFVPNSQQEAERLLNKMLAEGQRNVDVGLMQVNLRWHGHLVAKPEHLLNPNTNLEIGARLLAEAIQSAPDNLTLGVGRYYSWKNVPAAVEYGQRVIALADQIRTLI